PPRSTIYNIFASSSVMASGRRSGPMAATTRDRLKLRCGKGAAAPSSDCQAERRREGFVVLPRRWVVERTFSWFGRNRRLAKDFEASIASAEAWVLIASIRLLSRRLARA